MRVRRANGSYVYGAERPGGASSAANGQLVFDMRHLCYVYEKINIATLGLVRHTFLAF